MLFEIIMLCYENHLVISKNDYAKRFIYDLCIMLFIYLYFILYYIYIYL